MLKEVYTNIYIYFHICNVIMIFTQLSLYYNSFYDWKVLEQWLCWWRWSSFFFNAVTTLATFLCIVYVDGWCLLRINVAYLCQNIKTFLSDFYTASLPNQVDFYIVCLKRYTRYKSIPLLRQVKNKKNKNRFPNKKNKQ